MLKDLKERIENIEINYSYDETYSNLYNEVVEYMNKTQDFDLEHLFEDFVNYDMAEERTKYELENGGLVRLYYFLGDVNLNNNLFRIDGYGNLQDIDIDDLRCLKQDLLNEIEEKIKEDE